MIEAYPTSDDYINDGPIDQSLSSPATSPCR